MVEIDMKETILFTYLRLQQNEVALNAFEYHYYPKETKYNNAIGQIKSSLSL